MVNIGRFTSLTPYVHSLDIGIVMGIVNPAVGSFGATVLRNHSGSPISTNYSRVQVIPDEPAHLEPPMPTLHLGE